MMKKEKVLLIFCVVAVFAFLFAIFVYFNIGSNRLVDCRGEIKSIIYNESDNSYYIKVQGNFDGPTYLIKASKRTPVKNVIGGKMTIDSIHVGNTISVNYRGKWRDSDTPLVAKSITFEQE